MPDGTLIAWFIACRAVLTSSVSCSLVWLTLTMVACQVFLLNRSLHAEDLSTGLFERIRSEQLFPACG